MEKDIEHIIEEINKKYLENEYESRLEENEDYYNFLLINLKILNEQKDLLLNEYNIDITEKPWFTKLKKRYLQKAFNYYCDFKEKNFDFIKFDRDWFDNEFNEFMINVEKFISFFVKNFFDLDNINFIDAINKLEEIKKTYKEFNNDIEGIIITLHNWRKVFNVTKHNRDKQVENWIIKNENKKNKLIQIEGDVLSFVSIYVGKIMVNLLNVLILEKELKNKK